MKNIIRALFTIITTSSAFLIGFYFGKETVMSKIPRFQEDLEEKP
ncbi:hypothetical protein ACFLRM_02170 [Acidobacteriota bacterium]